ncbi:MAG TPA: hypothetical protein VLD67_08860 [Vicinamibacterales bacterium]|nr:hypothetical protein [Vicinamibacterales bacterium]
MGRKIVGSGLAAHVRLAVLAAIVACAPACLVLELHPVYDDESIAWEPDLLGKWQSVEDNTSLEIERGEWRSYRVRYVHPIETGDLTAYLTAIGDERYLDLMPARGQDRGAFLVPVHAILRVRLQGDRLEVAPLSYDWFFDRLRGAGAIAGLAVWEDQKENALIVSPTAQLRAWLRAQPAETQVFGAPAEFTRIKVQKGG